MSGIEQFLLYKTDESLESTENVAWIFADMALNIVQ